MTPLRRAGKFLSAGFNQPLGSQFGDGAVRGYPIDLRVKAKRPDWPAAWPFEVGRASWIALAQLGLAAYERFVAGEGEEWLTLARDVGDTMLAHQRADGAWVQGFDLPHTYHLPTPWISAMAQGQGASLLVRLALELGEERYADAARLALEPMALPVAEGGTAQPLDGRPFPQEYPTSPPSFVLNGGMYAMWGWHDAGLGLGDAGAREAFEDAVDTLALNLHRWDTGSWSRYDLYPHRIRNWSSLAYHELHVSQLRAMHVLSPRPELEAVADRWERHFRSRRSRARALAHKSVFRILVPR